MGAINAHGRARLIVMPGDGLGPEIMRETVRVTRWFIAHRGLDCDLQHEDYGVATYLRTGVWVREALLGELKDADAVLFGSIASGDEFARAPVELRQRWGMVRIRQEMGLFANLRRIRAIPDLAAISPLRPEIVHGADIMFVREVGGGVYSADPRGSETLPDGQRRAFNTQVYTTSEIQRIARVAFEAARGRRRRVTSVDKSNVMESSVLWREVVQALRDAEYPDITLDHMYADTCAMEVITTPGAFDIILADNVFGDLLSDGASVIVGSVGMLPSATFGAVGPDGRRPALYEPLHVVAPEIVGRNLANPIGAILCLALAFDNSLGRHEDARLLELAVDRALATGVRTADLAPKGGQAITTQAMGDAVLTALDRIA